MLDLLLLRAQQAAAKLYQRATVMPNAYELQRLKHSDRFVNLMLDAIVWIAQDEGKSTLVDRKYDIVAFGDLLAFVLWQLQQTQLTWHEYYNLLAAEDEHN